MAIAILLICFFLLFLSLGVLRGKGPGLKDTLLKSVLSFSLLLLFITEVASMLHWVKFWPLFLCWSGAAVLGFLFLLSNKGRLQALIGTLRRYVRDNYAALGPWGKVVFLFSLLVLLLSLVQGLVYPPNNWDSMTYHMARIPNWIGHQSVAHYPTHIYRQVYQAPFAEFVALHSTVLTEGDYFSNAVQWSFLVFSLCAVLSLVELIGLGRRYKLVAVFLLLTVPEVILQSSSTQNDIVVSFFILAALYFSLKSIRTGHLQDYLFLGAAVGLGLLTKGTAYIYLFPALLVLAIPVMAKVISTKEVAVIRYPVLAAMLCLLINSGHYYRNYDFSKSVLGVDSAESDKYSQQGQTPALFLSSVLKNAGLHTGPAPINSVANKVIYKLHDIMGVDVNNEGSNYLDEKYAGAPNLPNHEDDAPNPVHFFLSLLSLLLVGARVCRRKEGNKTVLYLALVLCLQMLLFCFYLKWQPWHSRLHTPMFMLAVPVICYALSLNRRYLKALYAIIPIMALYASFVLLCNRVRPLLPHRYTADVSLMDDRYRKYFCNRPDLYGEYRAVTLGMGREGHKNIGLLLGVDDWEYPLFSPFYGEGLSPVHIRVSNRTKDIPMAHREVDCIVSTRLNLPVITFRGRQFHNRNRAHKAIWLYE